MGGGDLASCGLAWTGPARSSMVLLAVDLRVRVDAAQGIRFQQDHLEENRQMTCDDFTQPKHVGLLQPPLAPRDQSDSFLHGRLQSPLGQGLLNFIGRSGVNSKEKKRNTSLFYGC